MTTYGELSNHIGGLIKILDPLIGPWPSYSQSLIPQLYLPSDQIALLLQVFQSGHRYDLYQFVNADMYAYNHHTSDDPLEIVVSLLINDAVYDVSIYTPRVELLL